MMFLPLRPGRRRSEANLAWISVLLVLVGLFHSNVPSLTRNKTFFVSSFVIAPSRVHASSLAWHQAAFDQPTSLLSSRSSSSSSPVGASVVQCWGIMTPQTRKCSSYITRLYDSSSVESEVEYTSAETASDIEEDTNGVSSPNIQTVSNGASRQVSVNGVSLNGSPNRVAESGSPTTDTNGANGHAGSNGDTTQPTLTRPAVVFEENDVPKPTENGGFSHTTASRAKISAANKGKTPWNKGRARSPEVRERIAAGVRAKNRERFLQKLQDMGVTEEEYEANKKEERRRKEAERRARRTENGGYRPTEETKRKISQIIKDKYARGEIKPRNIDPAKVRRGFTHSEETRAKISESLKNRWKNDPSYREKMLNATSKPTSTNAEVRQRISESLKKKWADPEFRQEMMEKRLNSTSHRSRRDPITYDKQHRKRISDAMKAKWRDPEYRERALKSIEERRVTRVRRPPKQRKPKKPRVKKEKPVVAAKPLVPKGQRVDPVGGSGSDFGTLRRQQQPRVVTPQIKEIPQKKAASPKTTTLVKQDTLSSDSAMKPKTAKSSPKGSKKASSKAAKVPKKKKEPDGSVNRLKEERRDLFDLLYGDDYEGEDGDPAPALKHFQLGDENLDTFDPYGLDDY